jgi:hypothetical protein
MNAETHNALATLSAAAAFLLIFYAESWWQPQLGRELTRRVVSFSVGMAVAYVFVHLLPELAAATVEFVDLDQARELPFPHLRIYGAALLGFMIFYGLENMVRWPRVMGEVEQERAETVHIKILTFSYALYVFVVCNAMTHQFRLGGGELALYAFAMGLHFLGFAYGLRRDSSKLYARWGRHLLATAALVGWATALLVPIPESFAYTLLGFVAGVLIMDTVTSELAGQAQGRFFAFLTGGVTYTIVLLFVDP